MDNVSIQEMRFEFGKIKAGLDRGEEYVLTYRNKPLARILPIDPISSPRVDPALSFGDTAEDLKPMTNREMDESIYG